MDGGRMAGNAIGKAVSGGASWVGNKVSGMFSRDQGAPAKGNTSSHAGEEIEMQDMSNTGPSPQKAMNGLQSEQNMQQSAAQQYTPMSSAKEQAQKNMSAGLDPLAGVEVKEYKPAKTPPKTPPKNDK